MAWNKKVNAREHRKLKILVVHEISYLEKVIYEIHEFPELLAKRGHEVTFIDFAEGYSGKPGHNRRTWKQKGRVYPDSEITIHSPWLSGLVAIDRLVALFTVWAVLWGLRKQRFDVILNYAVPTYGIQVNLWAKSRKIPIVHRALDVSHKIRQSVWNPAIRVVEHFILRMSTTISANNNAMASYVSEVSKLDSSRIGTHYPPTFNSLWKIGVYSDHLAQNLGILRGDLVIGYLGSFFYFSGLPEVLRSLATLQNSAKKVKVMLVGGGEQEQELRDLVKSLGLESKVIFTGLIAFEDIPRYLALFNVGINPMHPSEVSHYALPNKVLQYLAAGLPVVSTELKGLRESLIDCQEVSWVKGPENVLECALELMQHMSPKRSKERVSAACLAKFETKSTVTALQEFLEYTRSLPS